MCARDWGTVGGQWGHLSQGHSTVLRSSVMSGQLRPYVYFCSAEWMTDRRRTELWNYLKGKGKSVESSISQRTPAPFGSERLCERRKRGHGLCSADSPLFFFSCLQEDCEIDPIREKVTETHEEDTITQCHNSTLPVKLLGTMWSPLASKDSSSTCTAQQNCGPCNKSRCFDFWLTLNLQNVLYYVMWMCMCVCVTIYI